MLNSKVKKYRNREIDYNIVNFGKVVKKTFEKDKRIIKQVDCNKNIKRGKTRQFSAASTGNNKNSNNNPNHKTISNSKRVLSFEKPINQLKKHI